jgi:CheY-like chemotaxis protein
MDGVAESMTILMADDDPEDCMMTRKALEASRGGARDLRFVGDGDELMDYLMRRDKYVDPLTSPRPGIILLDLNMPKKDGHAALEEMKIHPEIRRIPVGPTRRFGAFRSWCLPRQTRRKTSNSATTEGRARSLPSRTRIKAWSKQ